MAQPERKRGSTEPTKRPTSYARVACACLRKNIRQARGRPPPWIRTKSPVSSGWRRRTRPKRRDGSVGGGSGSSRLQWQRCHSCPSLALGALATDTGRGAVSLERLAEDAHGDLVYPCARPWSDGALCITLSPVACLEKLAALVAFAHCH